MGGTRRTILAAALVAVAGCAKSTTGRGGAESTATPAATTPSSMPNGNFEVLAFGPERASAGTTSSLALTFSKPVDPAWILWGTTWLAAEDVDTVKGGSYRTLTGKLELDATGRSGTFTPDRPFRAGHEVRLMLSSTLRDVDGGILAKGSIGQSVAFTTVLQNEVFEGAFMPTS